MVPARFQVKIILFLGITFLLPGDSVIALGRRSRYFKIGTSDNGGMRNIEGDVLAGLPRILDRSCSNLTQSDALLTAPQLIQKKGFPFELHEVESDGYILELYRIPGPSLSHPVLVVHGMLQTSKDFLLQCKRNALAFKLADAGHDVWLANLRGNDYSRKHKTLSRDEPAYWEFTVDDLIKHDAPAMVNYILNATSQSKLTWIGFSLGTAIAMGMLSTQPEYNDKIDVFVSLAIVAYVKNSGSTLRFISRYNRQLEMIMSRRFQGKIASDKFLSTIRSIIPRICSPEVTLNVPLYCRSGTPSQWPAKVLQQWFQWVQSGKFNYYDFGPEQNLVKYGSEIPPEYDLKKVKVPTVNFWSDNDVTASPEDVQKVINKLPNVVANIRVPVKRWTHLDYAYGRDADVLVYDKILQAIQNFV